MKRVMLGRTGIETSHLGFGCASLGSRVAAAAGLRAIEEAFEHGVTWLDLAPAYGRGAAERIASEFLRGRRDRVQVATKVGLAPSAAGGSLSAALLPLARRAVAAVPGLRAAVRRSGVQANRKLPLTADLIRRSLEESLLRLGTDHVDLYALHNAAPDEVGRDEVLRALQDILSAGKARAVAVASDEAAARAALAVREPYSVVQIALPPPGSGEMLLGEAGGAGFGTIAHSVFGFEGILAQGRARIAADPDLRAEVAAVTAAEDPATALGRLLIARALALVPEGVVLVSMFSEQSRRENLAVAAGDGLAERAAAVLGRLHGAA